MGKTTENTSALTRTCEDATEPKFKVEDLKPYALKLFGVSNSTFAGATYGLNGEYTVNEMKSHIDDWLKKEVK